MLKGSVLQQLVDRCQQGSSPTPFNYGVYYKNTLVSLCHALEDSILSNGCSPIVMTAFQRGKWYLQEAERYASIADEARHIMILAAPDAGFADHPTGKRPNVSLVSITPGDPVAQEWHLVILSPTYTAMVMCQELTDEDYGPGGVPEVDIERKFYGFWTFEPDLVLQTVGLMLDACDRYDSGLREQLQSQVDEIAADLAARDTTEQLGNTVDRVVTYLKESRAILPGTDLKFAAETALDRNLASNEFQAFLRMAQAIDLSDAANPMAGSEVAALCEAIAQLLDLPAWQVKRLRLAALLHRIDYLPGTGNTLANETDEDSDSLGPSCPLRSGAQALRTMPKLRAIAQIVNHRTERWDGEGMPGQLAADAIPLESRIIGLLAEFQHHAASSGLDHNEAIASALAHCQDGSGTLWDPKLVETLGILTMGLQQGLDLPSSPVKVSAGLWTLDEAPSAATAASQSSMAGV
ncbi:MAG: DICT sensory domain-containing protein [Cyanobacteria bacterium P01_D01_bin.73]